MADNTIILQGKFTADGAVKVIPLRSDVDWMRIYNATQSAASTSGNAVEYYWQRGMPAGAGIKYYRGGSNASVYSAYVTSGGFTLVDTSQQTVSGVNSTITAVSTASVPIVSLTSTSGLSNGDVVRLIDITNASQIGGIDFTIDTVVTNTSLRLAYMAQLTVAGTTGSLRKVNYDPIFYPRFRYITEALSSGTSTLIKLSVTHGFTVGQKVKVNIPEVWGMNEIDGMTGNVTAINTTYNTITVDIDTSAASVLAFPLDGDTPFTPATVVPVGENVSYPDLNDDATTNTSYLGIKLAAGVDAPAGSTSDVIYWTAGKSFSVTNE